MPDRIRHGQTPAFDHFGFSFQANGHPALKIVESLGGSVTETCETALHIATVESTPNVAVNHEPRLQPIRGMGNEGLASMESQQTRRACFANSSDNQFGKIARHAPTYLASATPSNSVTTCAGRGRTFFCAFCSALLRV